VKFDRTRSSFMPLKHFSRVLSQQGRVQLDADWNEQIDILTATLRTLAADIIGPAGTSDGGFAIEPIDTPAPVPGDLLISPGHYYVDGILCQLEDAQVAVTAIKNKNQVTVAAWTVNGVQFQSGQYVQLIDANQQLITTSVTGVDYSSSMLTLAADVSGLVAPVLLHRLTTYLSQPDFPAPPKLQGPILQIYLDVWERLITWVEDDSIREVALNGPDTAARAKVVWQVKAAPSTQVCMTQAQLAAMFQPPNRGLLRARTQPNPANTNPCTIAPNSSYTGPENQCYRVEVHVGSNDTAKRAPSFVWSREDGCVLFSIVSLKTGEGATTVVLDNLGRDDRFGLIEGDIVEVQDDTLVLAGLPGPLLSVQAIDPTSRTVTLAGGVTDGTGSDPTLHPLLRRWDQKAQPDEPLGSDNAIAIPGQGLSPSPPPWLSLEDGVEVQFITSGDPIYRTGDYWLIPARVATGDVIWPTESVTDAQNVTTTNPIAMPPEGVWHHYAPLAVVTIDGQGRPEVVNRCRPTFGVLAKLAG
jgi:hypothetical protein